MPPQKESFWATQWDDKAAKRGVEQPLKVEDDDADMVRYGVHEKINEWRWM